MVILMQPDLFETQQQCNLRDEIAQVEKSVGAIRRGLFSRHTALEKFMMELMDKHDALEREVYRLRKKVAVGQEECQIYEKVM